MGVRQRFVLAFSFAISLLAAVSAQSAVLIVSNTNDAGPDSLRANAAAALPADRIQFNIPTSDPGYSNGVFTITLTTGEIVIDKDLTIQNVSGENIVISGNHISRIFNILAGTVAISDLSLINGKAQGTGGIHQRDPGMPGVGGAVLNQGTLTITRCTLKGNTALGGLGSSDFAGAGPGGDGIGGAIANQNSLSLVACTLVDNSALGSQGGAVEHFPCYCWDAQMGGMGSGGAIHNAATGVLSLSNCTIAANTSAGANARVLTDTFVIPGGVAQGGGIANFGNLTMLHCTVANNTAVGGASASGGSFGELNGGASSGGGLYCASGSVVTINDAILAPNRTDGGAPSGAPAVAGVAAGPDVNGEVASQGHNLLGRSDGCTGFTADDQQGGTTDDTALDPKLGPLADNGGPTETLSLLPGSPAIDHADLNGPSQDQRYFVRNGPPDIGAFEYQATQPVHLANISTRLSVQIGDNAMIGGFIIAGTEPKNVIVRGIGPSLPLSGALADPVLEIHGPTGELIASNDNWRDGETTQEIIGSGLPPANDLESAFLGTLNPGAYTVIVRGKDDGTGIGLFEVYDRSPAVDSKLANVSTRGFVDVGDNVMIGGTIVVGTNPRVLLRAIGPSLTNLGVPNVLENPVLELYDGNGQLITVNYDWRDNQEEQIIATGIPPSNDLESAIVQDLVPGSYTAIVRGNDNTIGVAVIEVYSLN